MFFGNGDFRFFWPESLKTQAHIPYAWDSSLNTGIGIPDANTLWITSYLNFTAYFSHLELSWNLIGLIFYILPIIAISFISSFVLFRTIIAKNNIWASIAGLIYTSNTYFLSVFLGGQTGVSFAYAFIPLVFLLFHKLLTKPNYYSSILFALGFSAEVLFDPRFAFITLMILTFYYLFRSRFRLIELTFIVVIPTIITLLLHSFWILPLILFRSNIIPRGFDSVLGAKFFSFAFLENSISLLHPNWPENIFGKTSFMQPEFLIFPVLAFASLLFIKNSKKLTVEQSNNRTILYLALLALLGAFLAKGTNVPFGSLFLFLFDNIPGFSVFRDPTKFYTLVGLSYSILIPYTLFNVSEQFRRQAVLISIIFLGFWIFTLRGLFLVDTNLLKARQVPESYIQLKEFIVNQNQFFRTLWIPSWQRYGYFSDINPAVGRGEIFKEASASGMIKELNKPGALEQLQDLSVKYVIIPEDSEGEIFLDDRKYSGEIYSQTASAISRIPYLTETKRFGKIRVFEIPDPKDRFFSPNKDLVVEYNFVNPTQYIVAVQNAKQGDTLVFSEGYDRNWKAESKSIQYRVSSIQYKNFLNCFVLPKSGNYSLKIYYEPQRWVNIGLIISGITLASIVWFLVRSYRKI